MSLDDEARGWAGDELRAREANGLNGKVARVGKAIPALLVLAIATACANPGETSTVADEVVADIAEGWQGPPPNLVDPTTSAGWLSDGRFGIVTIGSSSCPPIAESLRVLDSQTVRISFTHSQNDPCTADMSATTHLFVVPDEITNRPLYIETNLTDEPESEDLTFRID